MPTIRRLTCIPAREGNASREGVREGCRAAPVSLDTRTARRAGAALKARCTKAGYRVVNRFENEAVLDRMAERPAARPDILDQRRETVEHPFGSIKQWMGQGAFLMRRLENVRAEFSLTALAYNLRRAITILGLSALIAAVRERGGPCCLVGPKIVRKSRPTGSSGAVRTSTTPKSHHHHQSSCEAPHHPAQPRLHTVCNIWNPRFRAAMIASGSACQTKGMGAGCALR